MTIQNQQLYYLHLRYEGPHQDTGAIAVHCGWWCGEAGVIKDAKRGIPITMADIMDILRDLKEDRCYVKEVLVSAKDTDKLMPIMSLIANAL